MGLSRVSPFTRMATHPIGSKEWREEFAQAREAFLDSLRTAVASCSEVVCQPCSDVYTFGWSFEQGHTEQPWQGQGGLDYGLAYLRHMYDQGFRVGFGVAANDSRATVYLKAWECPQDEPPWPDSFMPATTRYRTSSA